MYYIKFLLIIIVWTSFIFRFKVSFLISLLLASVFLFIFLFQKNTSFLITALIFLIVSLVSYKFQQRRKTALGKLDTQIKSIEQENQNIAQESKRIEDLNKTLQKKILQIANLYVIGKQMSVSLEFTDIFKSLSNILLESFQFQNCYLLVVTDEAKNIPSIDRIYRIGLGDHPLLSHQARTELSEVSQYCQRSWEAVFKSQKPQFREAVTSIPLIVENKILGIICAENLKRDDFDNFSILGSQLALEIRKAKLYERIQELAITDGLTGVFLRRHFLERFHEEITRSSSQNLKFSVLMLDIDHFKRQNDTHGHLVGDVILKEIAQILKENLREIDLLGRYGGEEFSIVLPDTDKVGGLQAAERIRLAVEGHSFKAYKELIRITVSVGVAVFPDSATNVQKLIDSADKALYQAKQKGRNKVCIA